MQRRSRRRPGRSNQSGPANMLTVLTQNMQRLSNLQSSSLHLVSGFRQTSLSMPGALTGNPERGFMKKFINTHTVILQKHEELLARSAIDKKVYTW